MIGIGRFLLFNWNQVTPDQKMVLSPPLAIPL